MKLQTQIPLEPQKHNQIDYDSKLALFGSCFVENIGHKFNYYKFQNSLNPFGIQFHPVAIESLITNALNENIYTEEDLFFANDQWHSFEAHSKLSNTSKEAVLKSLNTNIQNTNQYLKHASHIVITLGTAWVYRHIETDTIVANCHKVPQKKFLKELLSINEIVNSIEAIVSLIKHVNPTVSFIFTVSPIRHIKDGFIENTQSKSHLISAIHQVVEPRHKLYYFPSYEIMMDELRDYRFYEEDMLHPNTLAIDYIWRKFQEVWVSSNSQVISKEVEAIQKGRSHKPFNLDAEAHQHFIQQLELKQEQLQLKFPHIIF